MRYEKTAQAAIVSVTQENRASVFPASTFQRRAGRVSRILIVPSANSDETRSDANSVTRSGTSRKDDALMKLRQNTGPLRAFGSNPWSREYCSRLTSNPIQ